MKTHQKTIGSARNTLRLQRSWSAAGILLAAATLAGAVPATAKTNVPPPERVPQMEHSPICSSPAGTDLYARGFTITKQGSNYTVVGVVRNVGQDTAHGPFKVVLGVSVGNSTRQLTVNVPSSVTIDGCGGEYSTSQGISNIAEGPGQLDMIVDSDNQVSEVSESNNQLSVVCNASVRDQRQCTSYRAK